MQTDLGTDEVLAYRHDCNGGHDSIPVFAVGDQDQRTLLQHAPTGAQSPRFFLIDESRRLLSVGDKEGGTFRLPGNGEDGRLGLKAEDVGLPGAAFRFQA